MTTYDPYKQVNRPKTGIFRGLPAAAPGLVLVVDREGRPLLTLTDHRDRVTAGEARFAGIRTIYWVDVTEHAIEFQQTLPCSDDVGGFVAKVALACRVHDPENVVRRGIHDAAQVLVPAVTETLKQVCRRFPAEQAGEAEEAAIAAVNRIEAQARHDPGFIITRTSITLSLDPAAAAFVRNLKNDQRELALQQSKSALAAELAAHEASRARHKDQLDEESRQQVAKYERARAGDAAELEQLRIQLAEQAREQEAALERKRIEDERHLQQAREALEIDKLELEIRRLALEQQRADKELDHRVATERKLFDHYLAGLGQHEFGPLVMRLVRDPDAIESVAATIAGQSDVARSQNIEMLRTILSSKVFEGWELEEQVKLRVTELLAVVTRVPIGQRAVTTDQAPQLVSGDGADADGRRPRPEATSADAAPPAVAIEQLETGTADGSSAI